jgi:hypothetical protein
MMAATQRPVSISTFNNFVEQSDQSTKHQDGPTLSATPQSFSLTQQFLKFASGFTTTSRSNQTRHLPNKQSHIDY